MLKVKKFLRKTEHKKPQAQVNSACGLILVIKIQPIAAFQMSCR